MAQGYLLGRPTDEAAILRLVMASDARLVIRQAEPVADEPATTTLAAA